MKLKSATLLLLLSTTLLAACANSDANDRISRSENGVDLGLERMGDRNSVRAGGAQFTNDIYVGASRERNNSSAMLPASLQTAGAINLKSRDPMSLPEIAQRLSEITGLPHVMALGPTGSLVPLSQQIPDAASGAAAQAAEPAPGSEAAQSSRNRAVRTAAQMPPATGSTGNADVDKITMRVDLRGSLSDVLDKVTSAFAIEWSYSDGRIIFRDFVTRKYHISSLPTTNTAASAIGSNSITSSSAISSDVWAEVRESLQNLVGDGATVSVGSTTGLVTITARVSDHNRISEYVDELNANLNQQIGFDVYIMTVNLNDEASQGLDLGVAIARGANGAVQFGGAPFASSSDMGSYNIGVIKGDVSVGAMVKALSSQGKVSVTTRAGTTTSNNRMSPIEVVDEYAYLKEATIEEDDDGDDRIVRTADTVTTGFQMQLFPRILNNAEIMVQYTVRLSELNDIKTFGEGNEAIQLPEVSTTSFEQQAVLGNGQTLVLAGFERERVTANEGKGVGMSGFNLTKGHDIQRVATVMMITPRLISRK